MSSSPARYYFSMLKPQRIFEVAYIQHCSKHIIYVLKQRFIVMLSKYWIYHLYEKGKLSCGVYRIYTPSRGSIISNLYHIETVNYNSILCKLFWYNM